MKKFLFGALLFLLPAISRAVDPVAIVSGRPESRFEYTNSTLSIPYLTVATITACIGYRQITIPNTLAGATSFYYRLDGINTGISTTGIPVKQNEIAVIESNQVIYFTRGNPTASVRYLEKKK